METIYTIGWLKKIEQEVKQTEIHYWDVILIEKGALKPLNERFKQGDAYTSATFRDEDSAKIWANGLKVKRPNAHITIKHWSVKNDEFFEHDITNVA